MSFTFDIYAFVGVLIVGQLAGWAVVTYGCAGGVLLGGKPITEPWRRRNLYVGAAVFMLCVALAAAVPVGIWAAISGFVGIAFLLLMVFRSSPTR